MLQQQQRSGPGAQQVCRCNTRTSKCNSMDASSSSNKNVVVDVAVEMEAVVLAEDHPFNVQRASKSLSFSNIQYSVLAKKDGDVSDKKVMKPILRNMSGSLMGGEMMCVLGPSGSGKTSLVQIIAGAIKSTNSGTHSVSGCILVDGENLSATAFRRVSGFVTQEDVFEGCLTVEETIGFKAALMLGSMTASERRQRVEDVIASLQLQSCRKTYIGDDANPYMKGISGGEKRRLAIAIEILDPTKSVLLADEPTSGLDSASAQVVVNLLHSLALRGMTVLCTLHQPRTSIMSKFDTMMVMANGRAVYYGRVDEYRRYLTDSLHIEIPAHDSPFDLLLDVMNPAVSEVSSTCDIIKALSPSGDGDICEIMADILYDKMEWGKAIDANAAQSSFELNLGDSDKSMTALRWLQVTGIIFHRTAVIKLRDPICLMTQISSAILMGLIYGALYINVYDKSSISFAVLDAQMCIVMTVLMAVWLPYDVTLTFPKERRVFLRERKAGLYTSSAFFIARITADMPGHILSAIIMAIIVWCMADLNIALGAFILIVAYGILIGASIMQLIGAVARTFEEANIYMMVVLMMSMMLGTGFVRETPYFLKWARNISVMGITSDLAMYREFKHVPAKYGDAETIYRQYGVLITNESEQWNGVLTLFFIWLISHFLCFLGVKFCFTGRTFQEDWRD